MRYFRYFEIISGQEKEETAGNKFIFHFPLCPFFLLKFYFIIIILLPSSINEAKVEHSYFICGFFFFSLKKTWVFLLLQLPILHVLKKKNKTMLCRLQNYWLCRAKVLTNIYYFICFFCVCVWDSIPLRQHSFCHKPQNERGFSIKTTSTFTYGHVFPPSTTSYPPKNHSSKK